MIEVQGLTKYYGNKLAIDHISFSVGAGEIVGLLGLNGAGKSTTMNILTGYISANEGTVKINGFDILTENKKAKQEIGYLPELFSFYPEMRVEEYLDFVCDLKGFTGSKGERKKHIATICEKVGIADMKKRMIRNLSKGYKQRVGLAQSLINNPKVLILDEPTIGLDPSQIIEIRSLIREIGKTNTIIVSSHILSEIQAICNRVLVINQGALIADDSPEHLTRMASSTNRIVMRIAGKPEIILSTLEQVTNVKSAKKLSQKEPNACDYLIESKDGTDLRYTVFYALAEASFPILQTYQNEQNLEDVFLHLINAQKNSEKSKDLS